MPFPKKMTVAVLSMLSSGVIATNVVSDGQSTETALPEQIGSMTSNGMLVYSMNVCTIVHSTDCQVSLSTVPGHSTSLPNEPVSSLTGPAGYGTPSEDTPTNTGYMSPPAGETATNTQTAVAISTSAAEIVSQSHGTAEVTSSAPVEQPSRTATDTAPSSTAGAAMVTAMPAIVLGAVGAAMAVFG